MKRRLLLLNVALLVVLGLIGWRLRVSYLEARAREQRVLGLRITPTPAPIIPPAAKPGPVTAAGYVEIAQKMLFSRDRNPTVVIDVEPPKPMPPLPQAYGILAFGSEPTVILTDKPGARQRGFRAGEQVGDFKLVGVRNGMISFEWEGQKIDRRLDEIMIKTSIAPADSGAAEPAASAQTSSPVPPTSAANSTNLGSETAKAAPGSQVVNTEYRNCNPGDTSPAGTVADGMRKVVVDSPFGKSCRWEPVK